MRFLRAGLYNPRGRGGGVLWAHRGITSESCWLAKGGMHFCPLRKCWNYVLYYQDNGDVYEVHANYRCSPEHSPVLSRSCFALCFSSCFFLDLLLSKMLQKIYRKWLFFFSFLWFHCMLCGCKGTSFGCPKRGVSSELQRFLWEEF